MDGLFGMVEEKMLQKIGEFDMAAEKNKEEENGELQSFYIYF